MISQLDSKAVGVSKNLRSPSHRVGLRSTDNTMRCRFIGLAWLGVVSLSGKPVENEIIEITDLGLRLLPIKAGKFRMGDDRVADKVPNVPLTSEQCKTPLPNESGFVESCIDLSEDKVCNFIIMRMVTEQLETD